MKNNEIFISSKKGQACRFGKWYVYSNGNMIYDGYYEIDSDSLRDTNDNDWILHMFGKEWIDWNEFIPAYFQALKNINIQFKKEQIFY